jgi:calcium/calmodulin-dependent protein kinase kinase 2
MEGILGNASRIVQPPLAMRPTQLRPIAMRKSKSQDTDDRRPIETALTAEGVHREIQIDDNDHRIPDHMDDVAYSKPGFRPGVLGTMPTSKGPVTSSPLAPEPVGITDAKVVHENMSYRPPATQPVNMSRLPTSSTPSTPIGKGHAHDPLEDHLYLRIGTGEDFATAQTDDYPVVSESPSNVDMDVYETAYQEEIARILAQKEDPKRRPTLYLTRRVDHVKSLRDNEHIYDSKNMSHELKGNLKALFKQAKQGIEDREERERMEGKESLLGRGLSKGLRNVMEMKVCTC